MQISNFSQIKIFSNGTSNGLFLKLAKHIFEFSYSGQSRRLAHRSKVASSSVILLASLNNNRGKKLRQNRPGGVLLRKRESSESEARSLRFQKEILEV